MEKIGLWIYPCAEIRQPALDVRLVARAPAPLRGGRPSLHSATLEHPASAGSSWSSLAASSAWIVAGTETSPSPESSTSATISSTKSGLPSAASRMRAWRSWSSVAFPEQPLQQLVGLRRGQRLEQDGRRVQLAPAPAGTPVQEFRPREAQQQERRLASRGRPRAPAGRGRSARPSGCRRTRPPRATTRAAVSRSLRTAHGISSTCSPRARRRAAARLLRPRRARARARPVTAAASEPRPPAST